MDNIFYYSIKFFLQHNIFYKKKINENRIIFMLNNSIENLNIHLKSYFKDFGVVESVNDGIVKIKGLQSVANGEMVLFCIDNVDKQIFGLILNLEINNVSAIVLGLDTEIKPGQYVI